MMDPGFKNSHPSTTRKPLQLSKCLQEESVTWSTERREIRTFPYPSVFELTGHQRLNIKRGIRNVGQFLAAEVKNKKGV